MNFSYKFKGLFLAHSVQQSNIYEKEYIDSELHENLNHEPRTEKFLVPAKKSFKKLSNFSLEIVVPIKTYGREEPEPIELSHNQLAQDYNLKKTFKKHIDDTLNACNIKAIFQPYEKFKISAKTNFSIPKKDFLKNKYFLLEGKYYKKNIEGKTEYTFKTIFGQNTPLKNLLSLAFQGHRFPKNKKNKTTTTQWFCGTFLEEMYVKNGKIHFGIVGGKIKAANEVTNVANNAFQNLFLAVPIKTKNLLATIVYMKNASTFLHLLLFPESIIYVGGTIDLLNVSQIKEHSFFFVLDIAKILAFFSRKKEIK